MGLSVWMLVLTSFAARAALALYYEGNGVVLLSASIFNRIIMKSEGVAVVEFYVLW